jgi:hypothetical protein
MARMQAADPEVQSYLARIAFVDRVEDVLRRAIG